MKRAVWAVTWAAALTLATAQAWAVPGFEAVRAAHTPSDVPLLARDGLTVLSTVRLDKTARRAAWVPLNEMSPALRHALLLSEDKRFWDHAGVDWRALAASAWGNAWNERTRGASTLTMQLAGLLDDNLARPAGGRSVLTKLQQMGRAQDLERRWSTTQILEAYLNQVPLRGELVGVPAASQQLFGKHPSGLDTQEAAVLAAMVRAPNATPSLLHKRACELLQQQQHGCDGLGLTLDQALTRRHGPPLGENLAPHLARLMAQEAAKETAQGQARQMAASPIPAPVRAFTSTLDAPLQRAATAEVHAATPPLPLAPACPHNLSLLMCVCVHACTCVRMHARVRARVCAAAPSYRKPPPLPRRRLRRPPLWP